MKAIKTTVCLLLLIAGTGASGADTAQIKNEFQVKREPVFEFPEKPCISRKGNRVTISFETEGFCDATAAIENRREKILRHLASGVPGNNAQPSFREKHKETPLDKYGFSGILTIDI